METPPHQDAGGDQQEDAAGEPDARRKPPTGSVVTLAALAQSAEHLALVLHRIGRLTRHAEEVGGLREQVTYVCAGLADGDSVLVHEALAFVAHHQAVPVWVVHDAVEGVQAGGRRGPVHSGCGGGDVVDCDSHDARQKSGFEGTFSHLSE